MVTDRSVGDLGESPTTLNKACSKRLGADSNLNTNLPGGGGGGTDECARGRWVKEKPQG